MDGVLIGLFVVALGAPAVDQLLRDDAARGTEFAELRHPAPRPALQRTVVSLSSFPEMYAAFFNDTFGLRDKLLYGHGFEKLMLLGVSATPEVVIGRDRWMFYTGNFSMEIYRGLMPLSTQELEEWRRVLEMRRQILAEAGIEYLFVIGPNKESIYPEYMPARFNKLGPTRFEQIVGYLRDHSDFRILDLRPALIEEKVRDSPGNYTYFQYGTHWNGRGSYIAYREILRRLEPRFPALHARGWDEIGQVVVPGKGDTWARMMYIYNLLPQTAIAIAPRTESSRMRVLDEPRVGSRDPRRSSVDDPSLPTALLFHDSFGTYVEDALGEHFSRLACAARLDFDAITIRNEKPQVVIELFVERLFGSQLPSNMMPQQRITLGGGSPTEPGLLFDLDVGFPPKDMQALGAAVWQTVRDERGVALEIQIQDPGAAVILPAFEIPKDVGLEVRLEIDSPCDTTLDVFYKLAGQSRYKRRNWIQMPLHIGHNSVSIDLQHAGIADRLMLRPGRSAGSYLVRSLDVYAEKR